MQIVISNRPQAIRITSFNQLLNLIGHQRVLEIFPDNAQLREWPVENIEQKIKDILERDVQVFRMTDNLR